MKKTMPDAVRFWRLVEVAGPGECWNWTGACLKNGYGTFKVGSLTDGSRRNVSAHRFSCELTKRPLLTDEQALHHCDNKRCVNPAHLYIGSRKDNARDAVERNRMARRGAPGERNAKAKLTAEQALEIRGSSESLSVLGRRYGVSKTQVSWIKSGKSWGHLNAADHRLQQSHVNYRGVP